MRIFTFSIMRFRLKRTIAQSRRGSCSWENFAFYLFLSLIKNSITNCVTFGLTSLKSHKNKNKKFEWLWILTLHVIAKLWWSLDGGRVLHIQSYAVKHSNNCKISIYEPLVLDRSVIIQGSGLSRPLHAEHRHSRPS